MVDRGCRWGVLALALVWGCGDDSASGDGTTGEGTSSTSQSATTSSTSVETSGASESTGPMDSADDSTGDEPVTTGDPPGPPLPCPEEWHCLQDADGDDHPTVCDNAPNHYNPDQGDMDFDSFGDIVDLCPTVQGLQNTADSDRDGVGNACDVCPRPAAFYHVPGLSSAYQVRNTPYQGDMDRDGVGDACDNCPLVPNCLGYGDGPGLTPWEPGMPLDPMDPDCNRDTNGNGIGDACEGMPGVGFGPNDDFDGDGIPNAQDLCIRIPAPPGGHADPDGDGIGTECDVCPFVADPGQADADGDFVGDACEENAACVERPNPRAIAFYDVSAAGYCCTTIYDGQPLEDPDGIPLSLDDLPVSTPGLIELPPGCEEALAQAGVNAASRLGPADVGGLSALWPYLCLLPSWDQDFDAIPDACDLCPFAFDPENTPYVDDNGMTWPNYGAYCQGEYHCTNQ